MSKKLIREYVRSVLSEMSMEDVEESKDPLDWITAAWHDPDDWDAQDSFEAMVIAARKKGLRLIGVGSSRIVFSLGDDKVVKLARNERGVEQNKLEATAGRDPHVHKILASVLDMSDEYAWLVSDAVRPLEDGDGATAEKIIGIPWSSVRDLVGVGTSASDEATEVETQKTGVSQKKQAPGKARGCLVGDGFLEALDDFLGRYSDMLPGDIVKLSSWGVSKNGCLVLLDYGITRKKFKELYR